MHISIVFMAITIANKGAQSSTPSTQAAFEMEDIRSRAGQHVKGSRYTCKTLTSSTIVDSATEESLKGKRYTVRILPIQHAYSTMRYAQVPS